MNKCAKAVLFVLLSLTFSSCFLRGKQAKRLYQLENLVLSLEEEYCPLKFCITNRFGDKMFVELKFLNVQGNVVSKASFELTGKELFFDFRVVKTDEGNLFFPYAVFTDAMESENAFDLTALYSEDGLPLIYADLIKTQQTSIIREVFSEVRSAYRLIKAENIYGCAVHDIHDFSVHFLTGRTYDVICHLKQGGIEYRNH